MDVNGETVTTAGLVSGLFTWLARLIVGNLVTDIRASIKELRENQIAITATLTELQIQVAVLKEARERETA